MFNNLSLSFQVNSITSNIKRSITAFKEGTTMELSPNVINIKYAIRDIVILAKKVEQQGKKLYYFNI